MFVAHAFYPSGALAFTRGGFKGAADAEQVAQDAHGRYNGGWWVIETIPYHWHAWAVGDHSRPVQGRTVATGGFEEEAA